MYQHKSHLPPCSDLRMLRDSGGEGTAVPSGRQCLSRKRGGGCVVFFVAADVITSGITRDLYVRREDNKKGRMDPMSCWS
jgi:hypothetical protein